MKQINHQEKDQEVGLRDPDHKKIKKTEVKKRCPASDLLHLSSETQTGRRRTLGPRTGGPPGTEHGPPLAFVTAQDPNLVSGGKSWEFAARRQSCWPHWEL
ncbi:hypothetical protein AB0I53_47495 [Saccharopolyspora sp. NPDC050389]|uniref:hypothetical protein n=1 Tax=Saccharopolyspora sp. NPDC050389 TaxID=3155516 RepID=UPI0033CF87B9